MNRASVVAMRGAPLAAAFAATIAACATRDACPRFAAALPGGGCGCADGVALAGGCVAPKTADAYCGPGARLADGVCAFRTCPDGQPLDVVSGDCVAPRSLREIAAASRVAFAAGERLVCDDGRAPVVDGEELACLGDAARCPRGTRAANGACVAPPRCGPGAVASRGRCAPVTTPRDGAYVVDVGAWARAVFGPDGGVGTSDVCAPLALRARALGVAPLATGDLAVRIALRFPGNDVADVRAVATASGLADDARASALADESLRPIVRALQSLGGVASTAALEITVRCRVEGGTRPHAAAR